MGNARVVRYLVAECGAAVDAGDAWDSWTPVFFAAKEGRAEVAKILLEARCDIRRKDRLGRTPLDLGEREISAVSNAGRGRYQTFGPRPRFAFGKADLSVLKNDARST
ncbi:MAG: hypothetical protein BJ554DRAFT_1508 [Olpidium bornovanus]|uniref:Ankyrin repeat protein n=1 Tax=Olpidium bornovanus TaxID=278681 RepID=A0A8H7ZRP3_9FUNG|nr:MAG: hypothetical protein BJ554DRAFT_1508 [Olpidium bornovanus]